MTRGRRRKGPLEQQTGASPAVCETELNFNLRVSLLSGLEPKSQAKCRRSCCLPAAGASTSPNQYTRDRRADRRRGHPNRLTISCSQVAGEKEEKGSQHRYWLRASQRANHPPVPLKQARYRLKCSSQPEQGRHRPPPLRSQTWRSHRCLGQPRLAAAKIGRLTSSHQASSRQSAS